MSHSQAYVDEKLQESGHCQFVGLFPSEIVGFIGA